MCAVAGCSHPLSAALGGGGLKPFSASFPVTAFSQGTSETLTILFSLRLAPLAVGAPQP